MELQLRQYETYETVEGGICACWNPDNITESVQGRAIYKDECVKCFCTPKSDSGLDVCLRCFQSGCNPISPEAQNHTKLHYQNTGHPILMNIKKVKKEGAAQEMQKVTKLAIGKPGGIDPETDNYEVRVIVHCLKCAKNLDVAHPKIQPLVDSVLLAQSANMETQVAEWEQEIRACEHTLMLDQSGATQVAAHMKNAKCSKCDLSSNLWLCMTCGHLGCGRKNYDGSGGNGHGLEHFEQNPTHCVNIKLGTITPEGKASIFCYACDDDVLDNDLNRHLAVLGINLAGQVKTEKSMTEMNLEINLSLTLSKVLEEGKQLTPLFGKYNTGMQNLGNTCYMNSVMQVLLHQQEFKDKYGKDALAHLGTCTKFSPDCFQCQMSKLARGLACGEYST